MKGKRAHLEVDHALRSGPGRSRRRRSSRRLRAGSSWPSSGAEPSARPVSPPRVAGWGLEEARVAEVLHGDTRGDTGGLSDARRGACGSADRIAFPPGLPRPFPPCVIFVAARGGARARTRSSWWQWRPSASRCAGIANGPAVQKTQENSLDFSRGERSPVGARPSFAG